MARVFRVWTYDKTYYIPASSSCQTTDDAVAKLGLTSGYQVSSQFTGDLSAQEWIAQQKAKEPTPTPAPTPTPTPTPTTPTTTPTTTTDAELKASIARKIAAQDTAKWSGKPMAPEDMLTPEEQEYLKATYTSPYTGGATGGAGGGTTGAGTTGSEEYLDYLAWQKNNPYMPIPKDEREFFMYRDEWLSAMSLYQAGYTREQVDNYIDEYTRFKAFASQYGDLNDWQASSLSDFITNYDKAQQQLGTWIQEAGPEATGFTDDQIREFKDYEQWYYQYGKPGEWKPTDVGDFIANQDKAQQQLGVWKQQAGEVEQYEIDPAEAARRREESYAEGRYAAKERYGETPEYQQPFQQWLDKQAGFSGALEAFAESEYPSLQTRYKAGLPDLTGFPTREEARAEKAKREAGFQAWLPEQTPEQPTTRTANW